MTFNSAIEAADDVSPLRYKTRMDLDLSIGHFTEVMAIPYLSELSSVPFLCIGLTNPVT
jgi:hypothetical protein